MPDWLLRALGPVIVVAVAVTAGVLFERFDKLVTPAAPVSAPVASVSEEPDPPPPPPVPPAPPGTVDQLPELPVQEVRPLNAHPVPDTEPPVPHVTLQDRQGNVIARPAQNPVPRQQAALPPSPAPPPSLKGLARATGTVSLAIEGHTLRLHGVLPPASTDRCSLGTAEPQPCAEVTQAMLAARLARSATVTCRMPAGASASDTARICLDATGVDLAGFLIAEGLAVADRRVADYAGAEGIARSAHRGLWLYR
jgi:endonuclease YncB( thermonuclease family)